MTRIAVTIAALSAGCGPSGSGRVPGAPIPTGTPAPVPELAITAAPAVAGLSDLVCEASYAAPLAWHRDGAEVVAGTSRVRIPAREVLPGTWVCTSDATGAEPSEVRIDAAGHNVLVVLIDDVGIDNVGLYGVGADEPPTPVLDQLAAEGVRFANAWAMPECSPTRAALLTGRYPRRTGVGTIVEALTPYALPDEEITIAELLGGAGYATALAGKWHLAPFGATWLTHPRDQGFDVHAGSMHNLTRHQQLLGQPIPTGYYVWEKNTDGVLSWVTRYATLDTTDDAVALVQNLAEPWFVFASYNTAHEPWHVPPQGMYTGPEPVSFPDRFDAAIEAFDGELGRLLDALGERRERTTVIVMADNGTPIHVLEEPVDLLQIKGSPTEGGVRVPLVVSSPLIDAPGSVSEALVSVVDLLPTAAALAGTPPPAGVPLDGHSLLPFLADPGAPSVRDVLYAEKFHPHGVGVERTFDFRVVRDDTWRLIRYEGEDLLSRLGPGPLDEVDLSAPGVEWTVDDEAAYVRLLAALNDLEAELGP